MPLSEGLSTAAIANPRLWRLGMELDVAAGVLDVAAVSTIGEEAALSRRIELAQGVEPLRSLEDAVYDNPMLLADFDRITLLLRTPAFAVMPRDANADEVALLARTASGKDHQALLRTPIAGTDAGIVCAYDSDIAAFVGRTFADARVMHSLVPFVAYFAAKAPTRGPGAKVFCSMRADGVDLAAFDGVRFMGATSYTYGADDAAYYAAALAQVLGIASGALHFYVAGAPAERDALASRLREFAPHVLPWNLPVMGSTQADNMPFTLQILPLCE